MPQTIQRRSDVTPSTTTVASVPGRAPSKRARGYSRNSYERTTKIESTTEVKTTEAKTTKTLPAYRMRGRTKARPQTVENEQSFVETTTQATNYRTGRRKAYGAKKMNQDVAIQSENPAIIPSNHAPDSSHVTSQPRSMSPDNHRQTYTDADSAPKKLPTPRRYRVRGSSGNALGSTNPKNTFTSTESSETNRKPAAVSSSSTTTKAPKKFEHDASSSIDEEQNYPEHFRALLKSNSSALNNHKVQPYAKKRPLLSTSTTIQTESFTTTSLRPVYKHKKIERPNLKLVFPTLGVATKSASTTTTEVPASSSTEQQASKSNAHGELPVEVTSEAIPRNHKKFDDTQTVGTKFSSKIPTPVEQSSQSVFRSKLTASHFNGAQNTSPRLPKVNLPRTINKI